jgi:hypothetical protein
MADIRGTVLGSVNDSWMAKELMVAYFADKDVISPKVSHHRNVMSGQLTSQLKQDVATGFEELMKPHHPKDVGDWS